MVFKLPLYLPDQGQRPSLWLLYATRTLQPRSFPTNGPPAFIALGMAQQQKKPVVLICTSGSAAYNYAPAVAEAYYQEIPLIVLTADRPPEWVNQLDGQTIQQKGIYGKHVKASFELPTEVTHPDAEWHLNRVVNEAILSSEDAPQGPVHINVPLREPFYPEADETIFFNKVRLIKKERSTQHLSEAQWKELLVIWQKAKNKLIIAGQSAPGTTLTDTLRHFCEQTKTPLIADIIANGHTIERVIQQQDVFLQPALDESHQHLKPDLLITFGKSLISKNLKRFVRRYKPAEHWHIQPHNRYQDTLQSATRFIAMEPSEFFEKLSTHVDTPKSNPFQEAWFSYNEKARHASQAFLKKAAFSEFTACNEALKSLPVNSQLHLANSMAVRYANFMGVGKSIKVYANRGTSGIDGSNSVAVGAALVAKEELVTLITGDMAFFYDRNAFWHNYPLANLRILILNNHGGGIFRMIDGPDRQPELKTYFETEQKLTAVNTAKEFGFDHYQCKNMEQLKQCLSTFYDNTGKTKILEVITAPEINTKVFKEFKREIINQYE